MYSIYRLYILYYTLCIHSIDSDSIDSRYRQSMSWGSQERTAWEWVDVKTLQVESCLAARVTCFVCHPTTGIFATASADVTGTIHDIHNISYHWYHWYHPVTIGLHRITYLQLALNWLHSWNMHEWTPNEMTEPEASGAKRGSSNSGCGPLATWNSVDDSTNKIGPKTIHFEYVDFNNVGRADIQMIQYLYLFRNWVRSPIGIAARWYSINHLRWLPSGYD